MNEPLRVGLAGFEGHFPEIMRGIEQTPGSCLVACGGDGARIDPASLASFAAVTQATRFYDDWRQMLAREELDVLAVSLQFAEIGEATCMGLEAGIHVMAEKPVATDWPTFHRLRKAALKGPSRLSALFTMRYLGGWQVIHEQVARGVIGRPLLAFSQKSYRWGTRPDFYRQRATYGGTIPWIGVHAIDSVLWATGLDCTAIAGFHGNGAHPDYPGCEDHVTLSLQLTDGAVACVSCDYLRPGRAPSHGDDRLRVAGSEGVIEALDHGRRVCLLHNDRPPCELDVPEQPQIFADFLQSLQGGGEHRIAAADALRITELCLYARDAADQQRLIPTGG
jgi:predicted dehydrogenase